MSATVNVADEETLYDTDTDRDRDKVPSPSGSPQPADATDSVTSGNDSASGSANGNDQNDAKTARRASVAGSEKAKKNNGAKNKKKTEDENDDNPDFRLFTEQSYKNLLERERKQKQEEASRKKKFGTEGRLVGGELQFAEDTLEEKIDFDPELEENEVVPKRMGECPKRLLGEPLEEIDQFVREKTFVMINMRMGKQVIYRFAATDSLFCLSPTNPVRKALAKATTNEWFDYFILAAIAANIVTLSLNQPIGVPEYVFLGIYTVEAILKILARGFFVDPYSYMRDGWNVLDIIVVVLGFVDLIVYFTTGSDVANVAGIRTFRILRFLRNFTAVPSMRVVVNTLLRSFPMTGEVLILAGVCLIIFGLFGTQLFRGVLRQKCVLNVVYPAGLTNYDDYYVQWTTNPDNWGVYNDDYVVCGNLTGSNLCTGSQLSSSGYYVCLADLGENPSYGYTNFDNIAWSILAVYSILVLDSWQNQFQDIIAATSPAYVLLYTVIVFFLSFYIINLSVAVIVINFEAEAKLSRLGRRRPSRKKKKIMYFDATSDRVKSKRQHDKDKRRKQQQEERIEIKSTREIAAENRRNQTAMMAAAIVGTSGIDVRFYQEMQKAEAERLKRQAAMQAELRKKAAEQQKQQQQQQQQTLEEASAASDDNASETASTRSGTTGSTSDFFNDGADSETGSVGGEIVVVESDAVDDEDVIEELVDRNCKTCKKDCKPREIYVKFLRFQNRLAEGVTDPLFDLSIMLVVMLNVISMAIQFYGMPSEMSTALTWFNVGVTIVFCVEATIKILALSMFYFKSGWNIFDLIVTLLSVVDVSVPGVSGLSVFRAFRLLRLLKLMESWEAMRLVLEVVFSTIGMLFIVTLVFIVTDVAFALIGLKLYGTYYIPSNFPPDFVVPRYNFTDMVHSMVVVFRIMCNDLIETFYQCMRCAGSICVIVYFPCLVFGNFMVTNLFLAMIIQAFGNETVRSKQPPTETLLDMGCRRMRELCSPCECADCKPEEEEQVVDNESSVRSQKSTEDTTDDGAKSSDTSSESEAEADDGDGDSATAEPAETNAAAETEADTDKENPQVIVIDEKGAKSDAAEARIRSPPPRIRSPPPKMNGKEERESADAKDKSKINVKILLAKRGNRVAPSSEKGNDYLPDDDGEADSDSSHSDGEQDEEINQADLSAAETMRQILRKQKMEEAQEASEYSDTVKIVVPKCCATAFYIHAPDNCLCSRKTEQGRSWYTFRRAVAGVVQNKAFDMFIIAVIIISSIELALEDVYLSENALKASVLQYVNISILIIFVCEMILKIIGDGACTYFSSGWTLLDFFIVLVSTLDVVTNYVPNVTSVSALRALRTLRALRPLRAISKVQSMRVVTNSLLSALPAIGVVGIITIVFWLIFAIMGTQLFMGLFWHCVDQNGDRLPASVVPNVNVCNANSNYSWVNEDINFDNVGNALLAIMQLATFQGWTAIMNDAVDSVGLGMQPIDQYQTAYYLYFFAFIIIGVFFSLNLFIGVIVDQFSTLRKKYEGEYLNTMLTPTQKKYVVTFRRLIGTQPTKAARVPDGVFRQLFYYISLSQRFEAGMIVIIIANTLLMCIEFYNESSAIATLVTMLNLMFTAIFTFEMIVKLIGLGGYYFSYGWNIFDFIIVMLSIIGSLTELLATQLPISPSLLRVFRVFRVVRILRMMRSARGIRKLIATLIAGLPSLANIAILLLLLMYIYSVICMQLFGYVQNNNAINDLVNFRTFDNAFFVIFQLLTAGGWSSILDSLWINGTQTYCNPTNATLPDGFVVAGAIGGNCGLYGWPALVLCTYLIIGRFVLLNMYIAVILENYARAQEQEEIRISQEDIEYFFSTWERYDPSASQFIRVEQLSDFTDELDQPFRLPKPNMIKLIALDIPISEGEQIHCLDVARAVISNVLGAVEDTPEFKVIMEDLEEQFKEVYPLRYSSKIISSTRKRKKEEIAAKTLQAAWIRYKRRRQVSEHARLRKMGKKTPSQTAHLINNMQRAKPPSGTVFGSQTSLHESSINLSKSSLEMRNLPLNTTVSVGNLYQATLRKIKENLKPLPKDAVTPIYNDNDMRMEDLDQMPEKPAPTSKRND